MISIEETLKIAIEAHSGQKDLDGKPAILHPMAVALMGNTDAEIKAGLLHDVIEDSDFTLDKLRELGVGNEVLEALELLTHDKGTTDYFDYVKAIIASGNVTAIAVKQNDLRHNLQRGEMSYKKAIATNDTVKLKELDRINNKHIKVLELFGNCK